MKVGLLHRPEVQQISPALVNELDRLIAALQAFAASGAAFTAVNAGAVNSGDATTDAVITNLRTRVGEIEALLQRKGWV